LTVGELPFAVRAAFALALLVSLAVAERVSDGAYWSLAVLAVFLLVVLPVTVRVFGRHGGPAPRASGRAVLAFAATLTFLAAVETALIPDYGLGATFWIVAILIPSFEVLGWVARREARAEAEPAP
jgi:hypothetical protein